MRLDASRTLSTMLFSMLSTFRVSTLLFLLINLPWYPIFSIAKRILRYLRFFLLSIRSKLVSVIRRKFSRLIYCWGFYILFHPLVPRPIPLFFHSSHTSILICIRVIFSYYNLLENCIDDILVTMVEGQLRQFIIDYHHTISLSICTTSCQSWPDRALF